MSTPPPEFDELDAGQADFVEQFIGHIDKVVDDFRPYSIAKALHNPQITTLPPGLDVAAWPVDLSKLAPAAHPVKSSEIGHISREWDPPKEAPIVEDTPEETDVDIPPLSAADSGPPPSLPSFEALKPTDVSLPELPNIAPADIKFDEAPNAHLSPIKDDKITVPSKKKKTLAAKPQSKKASKKRKKPKSEVPKGIKMATAEDMTAKIKEREKNIQDLLDKNKGNISSEAI